MSGRSLATGIGSAAQPQEGISKDQFDGARIWMALVTGQSAMQLVSALRLGEGLFMAALAVEAASQAESQDDGRPVTYTMGGQGLAGDCFGLLVAPLRIEGEDQPIAGGRCKE